MDISVVNALTYEEFVNLFGNVVEKCPIISAEIWSHRPFKDLADIEAHIMGFIHSLPDSGNFCFINLTSTPDVLNTIIYLLVYIQKLH